MIGRRSSISDSDEAEGNGPKGFDDFELRLGDVMRGERATMGKSLLDVQRELRIKAAYIAAVENCDPAAFDTPGFIAGYVRSYARYLGMDPDLAFATFCAESGFEVAHGMSAEASGARKVSREDRLKPHPGRDMFAAPATPFVPSTDSFFSRVEPGAIGSMLVLLGLIGGIGYGAWAVLQEVQRVQVAPVDQTPVVLTDIDPLAGAGAPQSPNTQQTDVTVSRATALDRLYRPQALDVPRLVPRDAPIANIDPNATGAFAEAPSLAQPVGQDDGSGSDIDLALAEALQTELPVPQVVEDLGPTIRMVATEESWVRVRSPEGNTLFETIMQPGQTYDIPAMEVPPTLRTGNSGAIYFAMGSDCYGPVGSRGEVTKNLGLERIALANTFDVVNPGDADNAINRMFADLSLLDKALPRLPCHSE